MLLVEKQISSGSSSAIMTAVKVALVVGTYLGGLASDRVGMRASLVLSFLLAGVGMGFLPFSGTLEWMCVWAIIAQLGQALFYSPARLLIVEVVAPEGHQESMGWLRTANNLGLIVSFSIGTLFARWGITFLMLFDSITSLFAAGVGGRMLPHVPRKTKAEVKERREALASEDGQSGIVERFHHVHSHCRGVLFSLRPLHGERLGEMPNRFRRARACGFSRRSWY